VLILNDSSTKESEMRAVIIAVVVAVLTGLVQQVVSGLWHHTVCVLRLSLLCG
jgi:hypothetical protein